jgi:hypothetical protein
MVFGCYQKSAISADCAKRLARKPEFFSQLAVFVCFSIKELPFGPWLANHRFLNKKYRACYWIID